MKESLKKNILVYVISKEGEPLMPTRNCAKVRKMLRDRRARVVRANPFTIQLLYECAGGTQPVTLGIDPGYAHLGMSASTPKQELWCSETELRTDIKSGLAQRAQLRRGRRTRKLRHRKARFKNRRSSKQKGWLPPTARQKIESHLNEVAFVCSILPVSRIRLEAGAFDIQKVINPQISGKDYQNGPQRGWAHVRQYVIFRDGHECRHCHGRSGDRVLVVHHLLPWPEGTDRPENQVTLCRSCHQLHHAGLIRLEIGPPEKNYKAETMMNIIRRRLVGEIAALTGLEVETTYGADTKSERIRRGYLKSHANDALVISGNPGAELLLES